LRLSRLRERGAGTALRSAFLVIAYLSSIIRDISSPVGCCNYWDDTIRCKYIPRPSNGMEMTITGSRANMGSRLLYLAPYIHPTREHAIMLNCHWPGLPRRRFGWASVGSPAPAIRICSTNSLVTSSLERYSHGGPLLDRYVGPFTGASVKPYL
jgi:hypothetical protein